MRADDLIRELAELFTAKTDMIMNEELGFAIQEEIRMGKLEIRSVQVRIIAIRRMAELDRRLSIEAKYASMKGANDV